MRVEDDDYLRFFRKVFRAILETRELTEETQRHVADGSVALLGNDQIGEPTQVFAIPFVNFLAENEGDQISILFDGSRIAQIAQLRFVIADASFRRATQLRQHKERNIQ